jgi:CheY-like chemotaxis protein
MMPEVDGKTFYDAIEKDHPQLSRRIVFMSGGAFTPRLRRFAASVPNPVLQKPVSREDLESMLSVHGDEHELISVVPEP